MTFDFIDEKALKATIETIKAQMQQKEEEIKAKEAEKISELDLNAERISLIISTNLIIVKN